jgi:chemotaxis protein methyltransferase CheR
MFTDTQFDRARRLALSLAGIELAERHRALLDRRRRRLGVAEDAGLEELLGAAEAADPAASRRFVDLVTTRFTGWFRHPEHFELAADHVRRKVKQGGQARLWSAGTATGEEAYSLAMALIEAFSREDPPVQILATDIEAEALGAAERGEYGERALETLSPARRARYLIPAVPGARWSLAPALRRLVTWRRLNLAGAVWRLDGPFEVIFCRNVLMYLESGRRSSILERMASLLAPNGLLLLDPAEHLGRAAHLFQPGANGVYHRREAPNGKSPSRSLGP